MSAKTEKKVVLVTGANQGLGFEIIHVAALREPESIYILGSRSLAKGHEAAQELKDLGVKSEVVPVKLDVTDDGDIQAVLDLITSTYGKLDVLINNAGISPLAHPPSSPTSLPSLREAYTYLLNTNLISVYIISKALLPLLHAAKDPKVINITSGLASMEFNLKAAFVRGLRSLEYGSSKVALNGVTVHMQAAENDRVKVEGVQGHVRFWAVQPGILRTAFNGFREGAKSPEQGAEVAVRLLVDGEEGKYVLGGTYWKCDVDVMEEVPW
ncbi:NAD(P)-binding protein [Mollisia scopiformis]|uniref:NAD(P)-binding protein n=1 Tax=Mollisia scopiformis TaxID=149040 RepID=A0A194X0T2_MOLSC|nr:NAD(P)-binding protein [Mollisia scopiformis]KUJ13472.1 NAD(P)-binding protein [Mollisia scopiformis]